MDFGLVSSICKMWGLMKSAERGSTSGTLLLPLLVIVLVGSLLRFPSLEHESLLNDELAVWFRTNFPDLGTVLEVSRPTVHPPGYKILLFFVQKQLGDSEFALRFPSAVAGILAIPMIYLLGAQLYSYREGLIAAALMAVAWCPIFYSQEARPYAFLLLFSILTSYLWISMVRAFRRGDSPSYKTMGLYLVAATVCAYLHYFGLYLVALQGLAAGAILARKPQTLLKIAFIYLLLTLLYLPWLPVMREHLNRTEIWIKPPRISFFLSYLQFIFNKSTLLYTIMAGAYLYLLVRSLKVKGQSNPRIDPLSPGILLSLWLVVPFIGAFIKSVISTPVLTSRNLIISLPPAYLLLSRAITQLPFRARTQMVVALVVVGLFLSDLILVKRYYSLPHKEQWREAVGYIVEEDTLYENSLIIGCGRREDHFNYYFSKMASPRRVEHLACRKEDITETMSIIESHDPSYIWFIRAHQKPDREFLDFLRENFGTLDRKRFIRADVWLFEGAPP